MANGQAEAAVKLLKNKLFALCLENQEKVGSDWDGSILYNALQIVRSDPSSASGFAPTELMIGRRLVYPIELQKRDIDFEGVKLTVPLAQKLKTIHDEEFKLASVNIGKAQRRYKKQYDKRNKVVLCDLKPGDPVQYKKHTNKRAYGKRSISLYLPHKSWMIVRNVDLDKKVVTLQTKEGKLLAKTQPIDRIRKLTI